LVVLLSQTPQAVNIADPTTQSKKVTTTTSGGKVLLDVNCPTCGGSGGGGGNSVVSIDGGAVGVYQLQSRDGGVDWPVTAKITESVQLAIGFDGGPVTALQGIGEDGGRAWNVTGHVITDTGSTTAVTGTVAVTQSGTWTVQPGNTPNTVPWLTTDTPRTVATANNPGVCVSVTTSSTTVLVSNASRRSYGFKASEDNTAKVYCKLGATATTANTIFGAGSSWSQDTGAVYTGVIDCIAASGTQSVCPYELN
jgi:hypothetical protein